MSPYHHLVEEGDGLRVLLLRDRAVAEDGGEEGGVVDPDAELSLLETRQLRDNLRHHVHHLSISNQAKRLQAYVVNLICVCMDGRMAFIVQRRTSIRKS